MISDGRGRMNGGCSCDLGSCKKKEADGGQFVTRIDLKWGMRIVKDAKMNDPPVVTLDGTLMNADVTLFGCGRVATNVTINTLWYL